mmetsp:Transcript_96263/g.310598  ORF Transcript_96263/g.310598 Transcript_96263/m.310598 type:complete len:207 (+) Transcript_96263:297-917(+)
MSAAALGHAGVVEALLSGKAAVEASCGDGHTALLYAVEKGLKDGLACPIDGETVVKPDAAVVTDLLLRARADANVVGPRGRRPLHVACAAGVAAVALVECLLDAGADADVLDEEGRRPEDIARALGHGGLLESLLTGSSGERRGNIGDGGRAQPSFCPAGGPAPIYASVGRPSPGSCPVSCCAAPLSWFFGTARAHRKAMVTNGLP